MYLLITAKDGDYMSAYLYDHAGERVWKMTGEVQTMTISGQTVIDHVALDRRTLYTNPYLIVTEAEYTKHYYAESQRIASKLGGGWAQAGYDPLQDHVAETPGFRYDNHFVEIVDGMDANALCVGIEPNNFRIIAQFNTIENQLTEDALEANQYFYHSDHLGSSSFITNASGNVDQHLQYLPFGEPWIDQRTSNNIRFTFSGKERDDETGYNYFGARYYNADISIWLSVDPLSDKYPSLSPYTYCANNPVIIVDPDGRDIFVIGELAEKFVEQLQSKTKMTVIRDEKGRITFEGEAKTKRDKLLVSASNSQDFDVQINATGSDKVTSNGIESTFLGGAYLGSYRDETTNKLKVNYQVNPLALQGLDEIIKIPGLNATHELVEGIIIGIIVNRKGISHDPPGSEAYKDAHENGTVKYGVGQENHFIPYKGDYNGMYLYPGESIIDHALKKYRINRGSGKWNRIE